MLMPVVPWLQPPNFLAALSGGAQAGEGIARTGLGYAQLAQQGGESAARLALAAQQHAGSERDAAERLKLAREELMAKRESDQAALEARRSTAADALMARQQQNDMLNLFKEQGLGQGQQRIEDTASRVAAANELARERLASQETRAADALANKQALFDIRQELAKERETRLAGRGKSPSEMSVPELETFSFDPEVQAAKQAELRKRWGLPPVKEPEKEKGFLEGYDLLSPVQNFKKFWGIGARPSPTPSAASLLGPSTGTLTASKELTADVARQFLDEAGGDRQKARKLARDAGYTF